MGARRHKPWNGAQEPEEWWDEGSPGGSGECCWHGLLNFQPPPGRGGPQPIPRPRRASLGSQAPWANRPDVLHPTTDELLGLLDPVGSSEASSSVAGKPPSAVLALLYDEGAGPTLVFTRRSWNLRNHAGEICFPGGRRDSADPDLLETALREAEEEVALQRDQVRIVGELPHLTTVSSPAPIVPFVGLVEQKPLLVPSADEVDAILHVRVGELLRPSIYREELWPIDGEVRPLVFFELANDTLWGATARILSSWLERLVVSRVQSE